MHRRLLASSLVLACLGLAACSSGGGDDGKADAAAATTTAPSTPKPAFACPVTRAQVETAYPQVAFRDSTSGADSCTFVRFDESGSLEVRLDLGGPSSYASSVAALTDAAPETVTGVGDEAVYSQAKTTLVARHGDDVLVLRNRDIDGFVGETDQDKARHDASIALAQAAFANG
jgi:predicted small secreted protein